MMFDAMTVARRRYLSGKSFVRMMGLLNDPKATEAQRERARDAYLDDLAEECRAAAGLALAEDNVVRPVFGRRPARVTTHNDGPEAA